MSRLILAVIFLLFIDQSYAQVDLFPMGQELKAGKLRRSFSFSQKKLKAKQTSKELQIIDTLLNGNCFLTQIKHKAGNYALLRKKGNRFELLYLAFNPQRAVPYFVNDSVDMNRDKKNEIIIYWSATLNSYSGYKTYEGTKTGLQIVNPEKRQLMLTCDLTSCGAGVKEGGKNPEGLCHYQFGISFMPMAIVVTAYKFEQLSASSGNPKVSQYNLKKNKFTLQADTK
jgi:hypothetical protein